MTIVERILYIEIKFECVVDGRKSFRPTPQVFQSKGVMDDSKISLDDWKDQTHKLFSESMTKNLIEKCEKFASAHRLGKNTEFNIVNITERTIGEIGIGDGIGNIREFVVIDEDEQILVPSRSKFPKAIKRKGYISTITDIKTGEVSEIIVRPSTSRQWTKEEIDFLSNVYGKISTDVIAEKLRRSKKSIWSKAGKLRKQGML